MKLSAERQQLSDILKIVAYQIEGMRYLLDSSSRRWPWHIRMAQEQGPNGPLGEKTASERTTACCAAACSRGSLRPIRSRKLSQGDTPIRGKSG